MPLLFGGMIAARRSRRIKAALSSLRGRLRRKRKD